MAVDFVARFAAALGRPAESLSPSMRIADLDVDSFALVDVLVRLQEEMGVRIFQEDLVNVETVEDLSAVFAKRSGVRRP